MRPIRHIVVGTDFSEIAERAVDHAFDLAAQLGATITLVHAYELPALAMPDGVLAPTPDLAQSITDAGQRGLNASLERRKTRGVAIRTMLRMGSPWGELEAVAIDEDADLIVVGTHGRRGFSRMLLGSVAERLVRTATHPVLVVHGEGPEKR